MESKALSRLAGVEGHHNPEPELESPFFGVLLAKPGFVTEVSVAVEAAVVEVDVLGPYNVEPIPSLHLANYLHPFPQRPLESCKVGYLHSKRFAAYLVQSYAVLTLTILGESFLLPASAYLLQPWHATSSS